jgi:hypothetical protein
MRLKYILLIYTMMIVDHLIIVEKIRKQTKILVEDRIIKNIDYQLFDDLRPSISAFFLLQLQ